MKRSIYLLLSILAAFVAMQTACLKKPDASTVSPIADRPLATVLKNNYSFSMFYSALQRTGLDKTIEANGPYTLLVPDNDAFARSGITADSLAKIDVATLKKIISYHIIHESITYSTIPQSIDFKYTTLASLPVYLSEPLPGLNQNQNLNNQIVHINGVNVNKFDIAATNGNIMVLNKVLYYPATSVKDILQQTAKYSYFVKALKQFGLFDQLDKTEPYLVMAPSNDAFLQYGLDDAAIAQMDSLHYHKYLFSGYIMPSQRFFMTDLADAPLASDAPPGLITPYYLQYFLQGSDYAPASFGLKALNYQFIESYYFLPPYYGNAFIWAPQTPVTDPDHQAANGVVHGIDALVMQPDSALIH